MSASRNTVRFLSWDLCYAFGVSTFGFRKPRGVHSRVVHRLPIRNLRSNQDSRCSLGREVRGKLLSGLMTQRDPGFY